MEVHKRYLFGVVVSIAIGLISGVQGLVAFTHSTGTQNGLTGTGGVTPHPLTLNTIAYASKAVGDNVLIPDANRIGPGYKIIGVQLGKPRLVWTNDTARFSWKNWGINFIISDRPFVNGTSMTTDFKGHWIVVMESPSPGILNSHDKALSLLVPQQVCQLFDNGIRTCTDVPTIRGQLIQMKNTWLVVDSKEPEAEFTVDGINRSFSVYGDMSYQQMLALLSALIP